MRAARFRRDETGQSFVELTLTLPVLLLLVLGTIDLGLGFKTYIALTNAAREGVRWVSLHPDDVTGALDRVNNEAGNVGLEQGEFSGGGSGFSVDITPVKTSYSAGDEVTVTIHYDYPLLFGFIPAGDSGDVTIPFSAHATMVVLYTPDSP